MLIFNNQKAIEHETTNNQQPKKPYAIIIVQWEIYYPSFSESQSHRSLRHPNSNATRGLLMASE